MVRHTIALPDQSCVLNKGDLFLKYFRLVQAKFCWLCPLFPSFAFSKMYRFVLRPLGALYGIYTAHHYAATRQRSCHIGRGDRGQEIIEIISALTGLKDASTLLI